MNQKRSRRSRLKPDCLLAQPGQAYLLGLSPSGPTTRFREELDEKYRRTYLEYLGDKNRQFGENC